MFGLRSAPPVDPSRDLLEAFGKALALIDYDALGVVTSANENALRMFGYMPAEIVGRPYSALRASDDATVTSSDMWSRLAHGETCSAVTRCSAKGGRELWTRSTFFPVRDAFGKVTKIIEQLSDITEPRQKQVEADGKIAAISRVQAVIEFTPQGEILWANDNFCAVLGYRFDEIKGGYHRMFVDPAYAASAAYADFWQRLQSGQFFSEEFKRIAKGGREIWIQASYNPILDGSGKVAKVVKFAIDITERKVAVAELNQAMSVITEATQAIHSGSQEISTAVDDMARRTETQAASLEETAAALGEITTNVQNTAENASHARTVVHNARTDTDHSGEVVERAVIAMGAIEQSSRQVGQIIGVIDEIAFQTNLLALNAGVEAARAGDAGRGFAVVAQEVRSLAQRSAEAAKEIKGLISQSGRQVDEGVQLVKETGGALRRIAQHVTDISDLVASMANAAQEQATALAEVNLAVSQMDQVTQQNAAMVEETAAASRNLAEEADRLNRLNGKGDAHPTRMAPRPRASVPAPARPALRTVGRGGAQRKPEAAPQSDSWEEF